MGLGNAFGDGESRRRWVVCRLLIPRNFEKIKATLLRKRPLRGCW